MQHTPCAPPALAPRESEHHDVLAERQPAVQEPPQEGVYDRHIRIPAERIAGAADDGIHLAATHSRVRRFH